MTSTDDLIARLRKSYDEAMKSTYTRAQYVAAGNDAAADHLTALQDRVNELEGALREAVEDLDAWVSHRDDLISEGYDVEYTGHVARRARAVLAKVEGV